MARRPVLSRPSTATRPCSRNSCRPAGIPMSASPTAKRRSCWHRATVTWTRSAVLIDHKADPNIKEKLRGTTAIMWAAEQSHPAAVKLLAAGGADVKAASDLDTRNFRLNLAPTVQARQNSAQGAGGLSNNGNGAAPAGGGRGGGRGGGGRGQGRGGAGGGGAGTRRSTSRRWRCYS